MQKYEFISELGSGSYGRVFLARSKRSKEKVAIKEIQISRLPQDEAEKALQEVQMLASLQHPNIVAHKGSFQERGNLYIIMEFVDGGDLSKKITERSSRTFKEEEILKIFVQIALALQYIHEKKIIHRDIKPQNIFLTRVGVVKLGDFGVARKLSGSDDLAQTVIGTPYYLSPEIWGNMAYNSQTDIWSLGCILYEMCALHRPFGGQNAQQLYANICKGDISPLPVKYSKGLRSLIFSMLSPDPNSRPTMNQIMQLAFVQSSMKLLAEENESKLKTVNIMIAQDKEIRPPRKLKSPQPVPRPVPEPKTKSRLVKIKSRPELKDNTSELPLPNVPLPSWATRTAQKAQVPTIIIEQADPEGTDTSDATEWDNLKEVNVALQDSFIAQAYEMPSWLKEKEPPVLDQSEIASKASELKNKLIMKNGEELFGYLRYNIENEANDVCEQFVSIIFEQDPESVLMMRELISIESQLH